MKSVARKIIDSSLKAVDPFELVKVQMSLDGEKLIIQGKHSFDLSRFAKIYLIGTGKGTAPMASAVEGLLGDRITAGAIVVKYGHAQHLKKIKVFEAAHPVPDQNGLMATKHILDIAKKAGPEDLVIVLLTGGGSALLECLPDEITLTDLMDLNRILLSCGASINEINTIRKHISLVKGGRLAYATAPAQTITLILSDVIGDPIESIASGPTAPDPTTYLQALEIIQKYHIQDRVGKSIVKYLSDGESGKIADTPDVMDPVFEKVRNIIIGNNRLAVEKARETASANGYKPVVLTDRMEGEVKEIARLIGGMIKSGIKSGIPADSPACLILGGEPTVTINGMGLGGRNQEMALAVLQEMKDINEPFYFCSIGTDGSDGPTEAAGAWIDQDTFSRAVRKNLDPGAYLQNNDSYHFFKKLNQLVVTGPTRTNVMDLIFCLY
ncbi:MAG: glycerate kinase [Calditrichaceae bacterium]